MRTLTPNLSDRRPEPLYQQLFLYIRDAILDRQIPPGEKLPSLRSLARSLGLSLTTVQQAYEQLLAEGYISSRPQSGYYVNRVLAERAAGRIEGSPEREDSGRPGGGLYGNGMGMGTGADETTGQPGAAVGAAGNSARPLYADPACFDFTKWKKCLNAVLNEQADELLQEGDPRGEEPLRRAISSYIYQARGVRCGWDQIVIGAGTQQLVSLLCILLHRVGIDLVSFEEPGYLPVRGIFRDRGFQSGGVPVDRDGIQIERLPANIRSTVYVSPSNQFPTGSIMPAARRYALLDWAAANGSIIIEDDYNSELRYAGRPVPSLQGLDNGEQVVYLGSFSSTLFPAIKISFMVLPRPLLRLFESVLGGYTQTCSKTEQLTLALYMRNGSYQIHLKKLRKLYAQKIQAAAAALQRHAGDKIRILSNSSGLHMLLELTDLPPDRSTADICDAAAAAGLSMAPVAHYLEVGGSPLMIFYYTRIPLDQMETAVADLARLL